MNAPEVIHMGEIRDMPAADYFAVDALSNSALRHLARSAWHYKHRQEITPTPAMKAGTLAHARILEFSAFNDRYVVKPAGFDGRTKDGKAWMEANTDREQITADEFHTAATQAEAVHAVPVLAEILSSGYAESSVFWRDKTTGVRCKARPDWVHTLPDGRVVLLDLKTTKDESPEGFSKAVANLGYYRQAAWYTQGFEAATGKKVAQFVFAAVTSAPPILAVPYLLDDEAMDQGRQECADLLQLFKHCTDTGNWPAYGAGYQLLSLPVWARTSNEIEVSYAS